MIYGMDSISLALSVITAINAGLGIILIINSGSHLRLIYAINVLTILSWTGTIFFFRIAPPETVLFWTKTLYISASLIASTFLYFSFLFPKSDRALTARDWLLIFLPNILVVLLVLSDSLIIQSVVIETVGENTIVFGPLYPIYGLYILFYFFYGFYRLFGKYRKSNDNLEKRQILYILVGYLVAANIAFVSNLILPGLGNFKLH